MSSERKAEGPGAPWAEGPPDRQTLQRASRDFLAALSSPEGGDVLDASAGRMAEAWSEDLLAGYRVDRPR